MFATSVLLAIAGALGIFYWYRKSKLLFLKKVGIDGPQPDVFFGNLAEMANKPLFRLYLDWRQKYGNVFGYYEGPVPVIVTSDLEILKQVFVKKFSNFHSRKYYPLQPDPDDTAVHMLSAQGERWKRLRTIINPTFSATKMKLMSPLIHRSIDDMMDKLKAHNETGEPIEIYSRYQGLTLDVIGSCAFGMDVQSQKDPNDPFLFRCRQIFMDGSTRPFLLMIALLIPEFGKFWNLLLKLIHQFKEDPTKWLTSALANIITLRKNEEYRRVDLLQLMLDAEEVSTRSYSKLTMTRDSNTRISTDGSDEDEIGVKQANGTHADNNRASCSPRLNGKLKNGHVTTTNGHANGYANGTAYDSVWNDKPPKKALSHEEIKAQSVLFLLAGYETTSTAMAYITYELVMNPPVQEKLQEEIDRLCPKEAELTYDMVHNMPYMEMVISEVLRKYPLVSTITNRLCMESCTINGVFIPKGAVVQANVWAIHYDPDIWGPVDPKEFYPERFSPDYRGARRHPMAWMPFGAGPRNCVGMRFAFLEMKLSLVRILQNYTLTRCEQTQVPLEFREGGTIVPRDGVQITIHDRQNIGHR
ncbi:cytochrome P450 3A29-like [Tubulanus polymorphus]|uniref:cytochrome P450 3A29-like n=1 Tax=Tubulanus polymorphus TaxID=672921 RepID=UPI003DA2350B